MNRQSNLKKIVFNNKLIFGLVCLAGFFAFAACNNSNGKNNPLGPSSPSGDIRVSPEIVAVARGAATTFTAKGGTGTYTWTVNNTALATINPTTGAFTAGNTGGAVTVTALDTSGRTAKATVNIVSQTLIVSPANAQVAKGGSQTFTSNGTGTVFWSLSDTSLGAIGTTSGKFTANGNTGSASVTAVDSTGNSGSTSVLVFTPNIVLSPGALTLAAIPTQAVTYTATGAVGTVFFSISGQTNGYAGVSINSSTGVVTIAAMPTNAEGTQTLLITATDGIAANGTAVLVLVAP
jgi:hypothetical protein